MCISILSSLSCFIYKPSSSLNICQVFTVSSSIHITTFLCNEYSLNCHFGLANLKKLQVHRRTETTKTMGFEEGELERGRAHQAPTASDARSLAPCLSGLPWASRILAADIEKTTTIFKSFHETSIRNLLFLEARVAALEKVQIQLDREDTKLYDGQIEMKEVAASWEQFALLSSHRASGREKKIPDCALRHWQEQRNSWIPASDTQMPDSTRPETQGPDSKQDGEEVVETKKQTGTESLNTQDVAPKPQEMEKSSDRRHSPEKISGGVPEVSPSGKPDTQNEDIPSSSGKQK